jgi:hypothetical protein
MCPAPMIPIVVMSGATAAGAKIFQQDSGNKRGHNETQWNKFSHLIPPGP